MLIKLLPDATNVSKSNKDPTESGKEARWLLNLETAIEPSQEIQDFDSESFQSGIEHSQ